MIEKVIKLIKTFVEPININSKLYNRPRQTTAREALIHGSRSFNSWLAKL